MDVLSRIFSPRILEKQPLIRHAHEWSRLFNGLASRTLDNGLKADIRTDKKEKILSVSVHVNAGANADPEGKSGMAHLLEHMLFSQNADIIDEIQKGDFGKRGGEISAHTDDHETVYEFSIIDNKQNRDSLFSLISRTVFYPSIEPEQLKEEKKVVLNEAMGRRDRLDNSLVFHINKTAFGTGDHETIGSPEEFSSITVDDLMEFHAKHYVPSSVMLKMVGPCDRSEFLRNLKKYFSDIPADGIPTDDALMQQPDAPDDRYVGGFVHLEDEDLRQTEFGVAFNLPPAALDEQEMTAASVLSTYLALALRDKMRGPSDRNLYGHEVIWGCHQAEGVMIFAGDILPEDAGIVLPAIAEIVEDIAQGRIDPQRFEAALAKTEKREIGLAQNFGKNNRIFSSPLEQKHNHNIKMDSLKHVDPEHLSSLVSGIMLKREPTLVVKGDNSRMQSFEEFKAMLPSLQAGAEKEHGVTEQETADTGKKVTQGAFAH